ncbi:MAG: AAC(3) family N-acetyltransferase [bacterium]|nr:AAC(3) family N-acetyltransferase [bacterium]
MRLDDASEQTWSVAHLVRHLRDMGVSPGDTLFVHTGLRATGMGQHDVPNLLDAYREAVGSQGNVFFPTHTYCNRGGSAYHVNHPCDSGIGAWPELARRVPGVVRGHHPTHSNAGIGTDAAAILAGEELAEGVGIGSTLDKLYHRGATVLMVGCGLQGCTALHLAETRARVPYLGMFPGEDTHVTLSYADPAAGPGGRTIEHRVHERPGCSHGFPTLEPALRAAGAIRDGRLAEASVAVCEMKRLVDAAVVLLKEDPFRTLCRDPECRRCPFVREHFGLD